MKKRDFLKAGAVAAALAIPAAARAQGASYNWKMATGWGGGPLMDIGAKAFAEKLDQFSGGRFKIQVFPGGALGNALKVPETVKNGVAEMGHTWMGYDWGKDPTTVLFGGVNADQCVLATLMDANFLGYDTILVEDCSATTSPDYCMQATLYNVRTCFGCVVDSAAVLKALGGTRPARKARK